MSFFNADVMLLSISTFFARRDASKLSMIDKSDVMKISIFCKSLDETILEHISGELLIENSIFLKKRDTDFLMFAENFLCLTVGDEKSITVRTI